MYLWSYGTDTTHTRTGFITQQVEGLIYCRVRNSVWLGYKLKRPSPSSPPFVETRFLSIGPGCPETPYVDQTGLELTEICLPVSLVLKLKVCTTKSSLGVRHFYPDLNLRHTVATHRDLSHVESYMQAFLHRHSDNIPGLP